MADDLKSVLTKVLASGGEKKFFFAYGMGKRKDGKGEGELAVSGKKPKKNEIEGALAACKEVLEGVCWVGNGNDNGETVYFQTKGKQLSTMVVSKMILTAKSAVGRHYDFQIPSAEEEQRVAALAEGVGEEGHGGTTEIPTAPPKQPTSTPNLEAAYVARANALTEDLKKAVASGTPAGNEAKLRFAESQVLVRKKELSEAIAMLGVVEEQIKKAISGVGGADLTAEWKARLAEWSPAIKSAILAKGPNAAAMTQLLTQANVLAKPGGDVQQAIVKLTECHALAAGGGQGATTDPAAQWKAKLAEWSPAIKAAMAAKGPHAADIAKLLSTAMTLAKPGGDMTLALAKLTECHALTTGGASQPGTDLKSLTDRWKAEQMKVLVNLKDTIKMVIATNDPEAGLAELELKAVMKQLSGKMETQQQAVEMEPLTWKMTKWLTMSANWRLT